MGILQIILSLLDGVAFVVEACAWICVAVKPFFWLGEVVDRAWSLLKAGETSSDDPVWFWVMVIAVPLAVVSAVYLLISWIW
jgi:hypothetical protein